MVRSLSRTVLTSAARFALLGLVLPVCVLAAVGQAAAQEPTDDQKSAIKANCRSDFMSYCFSVPRGGAEAFQCLKKNLASLSPGCQQAVNAIKPPAPPPAAAKAAPAAPAAPAASAAPPPAAPATPATTTPAAPAPATAATPAPPPAAPKSVTTVPSPAPAKPVATTPAAPSAAAKSAATPPIAQPVAPASPPSIRVVRPMQVLFLVRNSCRDEYRAYCSDVDIGGGRVVECLEANAASLSPVCRSALADLGR